MSPTDQTRKDLLVQTSPTYQTKKDLQDAFWLLYAKKDVDYISVRELTELAGYNRGTFYLHYNNIYALFEAAQQDLFDQMDACLNTWPYNEPSDPPSKKDLMALMMKLLTFYENNRSRIIILLGDRGNPAFIKSLKERMKRIPLWHVSNPALKMPAGERELLLEQTVSGVLFLISNWLADSRGVSASRLLHLIYDSSIKRQRTTE